VPADVVAARLDAASYLSRLSEDHQTILGLRYWDDLSAEQIAGRLGISVRTLASASAAHFARRRMSLV